MFCTLVCCMDGRFIHILNEYIRSNYRYTFVDTITDAGTVNKIVSDENFLRSIEDKVVLISVNKHKSDHIFVAGHSDCAGCQTSDERSIFVKPLKRCTLICLTKLLQDSLFIKMEKLKF